MKKLRPYLPILQTLALGLLGLCWKVVRQVTFPGRKKPGNVLSSIFLLFAGLTELVVQCREALLGIPLQVNIPAQRQLDTAWRFGKKWIRLGTIVATWALFILSSLEWTPPPQADALRPATTATVDIVTSQPAAWQETPKAPVAEALIPITGSKVSSRAQRSRTERRWLLLCTLRI